MNNKNNNVAGLPIRPANNRAQLDMHMGAVLTLHTHATCVLMLFTATLANVFGWCNAGMTMT